MSKSNMSTILGVVANATAILATALAIAKTSFMLNLDPEWIWLISATLISVIAWCFGWVRVSANEDKQMLVARLDELTPLLREWQANKMIESERAIHARIQADKDNKNSGVY